MGNHYDHDAESRDEFMARLRHDGTALPVNAPESSAAQMSAEEEELVSEAEDQNRIHPSPLGKALLAIIRKRFPRPAPKTAGQIAWEARRSSGWSTASPDMREAYEAMGAAVVKWAKEKP